MGTQRNLGKNSSSYDVLAAGIQELLEHARHRVAKAANTVLTVTYWEIGRRIIEHEQEGRHRADYGKALLKRLATDLTERLGSGFSQDNLENMRRFYLYWPARTISETLSRKSKKSATVLRKSSFAPVAPTLPLSWSHYTRLLRLKSEAARDFYETEALRGGWSFRQLGRQIDSQFYERTALSRNKAAVLVKGRRPQPGDESTVESALKDPYILEFLGLRDEYSESDLEEALIRHLESFLLELGGDFTFVGRQKRLRVGDEWYRVDLVLYHRRLRCLVLVDLKLGRFSHADAGQMHLYLNYAREHWTHENENPPVGLILCAAKDAAVAHYALDGLPNKVVASEYRTILPAERALAHELERTRHQLGRRRS